MSKRLDVLMTKFGRRLSAARLSAGFETAADCARAMGIHVDRYRPYERGERVPPLDVLELIHEHLNVSLDWLLIGIADRAGTTASGAGPKPPKPSADEA